MQDDATATARRQDWMRTLGSATSAELDTAWQEWHPKPEVQDVRGPEAGLVMVRGRIDAGGARFNLGEATVTRSTVRLQGTGLTDDLMGSSYVLGTDLEHARLAAVFDGLLTDPTLGDRVQIEVIGPLARRQDARDAARHHDAQSTLVDFFTVSREHS